MYKSVVLFCLVLAGCANSRGTYLPDGRRGYAIDCSGSARTWQMCETKAGDLCGSRGYEVVSRTGDQGAVASGYFASSVMTRGMTIACK